jgi:hypothetical protein
MRWFALAATHLAAKAQNAPAAICGLFHVKQEFGDYLETRAARSRDVIFGPQ